MIDIHCHILAGLDDGAADLEESLAMARIALADGVETIVATPHVNSRFGFDVGRIETAVDELNATLEAERLPLEVVAGAELAVTRLLDIDDPMLGRLTLGSSPYVLIESPYLGELHFLDAQLTDLQTRGFIPILAHPERCPWFQQDRSRLAELVEHGVLCQLTASAVEGAFGTVVEKFAEDLINEGLVHCVGSDGHNSGRRGPEIGASFRRAGRSIADALGRHLTVDVPAAILAGELAPSLAASGSARSA